MLNIDVSVKDPEVPFTCPKCGQKTLKKLSWLASNDTFSCPCGVKVAVKCDEFIAVQKQLDSLRNVKL